MNGDAGKALEELELAIYDLATGTENIKIRLMSVFSNRLHHLRENDFPEELRNEWVLIKKRVTKSSSVSDDEGEIYIGSVENTIKRMRKVTASKIAKDIIILTERLRAYFEDMKNES